MQYMDERPIAAKPIHIGGIAYACGSLQPIDSIPALREKPADLTYLRKLGLRTYSVIGEKPRALLKAKAMETLAETGVQPKDVDAVIFFSTTFRFQDEHSDLALITHELGMSKALPFGMFLNQCSNYTQALLFAKQLAYCEGMKNMLILNADILDDSRFPRVMDARTSVYGDVVLTFMVSTNSIGGYRIADLSHRYVAEMATLDAGRDIVRFITAYSDGFKSVCRDVYERTGTAPSEYKRLITANYNHSVLRNLALLAGMKEDSLYMENIPRFGHCFSADQLISLNCLERSGPIPKGSLFLLVAVGGFVIYSACALERV